MDEMKFDAIAITLAAGSRRRVLRGLARGGLVVVLGLLDAKGTGAIHFGCRHVGKPCRHKGQCCSGVCHRGRCRAHGKGTCAPGQDVCTQGFPTTGCNGSTCACYQTTGGASFCGQVFITCTPSCVRDADCEASTGVEGSACAQHCATCGAPGCVLPCATGS